MVVSAMVYALPPSAKFVAQGTQEAGANSYGQRMDSDLRFSCSAHRCIRLHNRPHGNLMRNFHRIKSNRKFQSTTQLNPAECRIYGYPPTLGS